MNIRESIEKSVLESLEELQIEDVFPIKVSRIQRSSFGDYSVSVAMEIAKAKKENPMEVAEKIKSKLKGEYFEKIEIAYPGFINFYISKEYYYSKIEEVFEKQNNFGQFPSKKEKIQVEFISANPTGPLTVGNGRGGPFGDVLGNILKKYGYEVKKAYYINDYGKQILYLGHSIIGSEEAKYSGEYIDKLKKTTKRTFKSSRKICSTKLLKLL